MVRFYYERTHREVEIPDHLAAEYDGRKRYRRLEPLEPIEVPDGSVAEVLEWVGDDPARRQAALEAELQGKNRATLLRGLAD